MSRNSLAWTDRLRSRLGHLSTTGVSSQVHFAFLVGAFATAGFVAVLSWIRAVRLSPDGVTTDSGARTTLIALAVAFLLAIAVRSIHVWTPRTLRLLAPAATIAFTAVAAFLFGTGRLDAAYSLYGGLHVLRSDKLFSDSHWVLSWFDCGLCERWDPHYGPTLQWLDPLTGGAIGLGWLMAVGVALALLGALSLWLLGISARGFGVWLIALASISPAWLLLVDRANADLVIFVACVIGLFIVAKHPNLTSWSLYAAGLWVLGTIKYFPFAMGAGLLLALAIPKGWRVVAGFLLASGIFVLLAWDSYTRSSEWNSTAILVLGDFPAYGRIQVTDMVTGLDGSSGAVWLAPFLLTALTLLSAAWGWSSMTSPMESSTGVIVASLALSGAAAFLGKILWGGFGFLYSGVFLLMVVPMLSAWRKGQSLKIGSNVAAAALLLLAVFTAYNTMLATLSGLMVAGFAAGGGLRVAIAAWNGRPSLAERPLS